MVDPGDFRVAFFDKIAASDRFGSVILHPFALRSHFATSSHAPDTSNNGVRRTPCLSRNGKKPSRLVVARRRQEKRLNMAEQARAWHLAKSSRVRSVRSRAADPTTQPEFPASPAATPWQALFRFPRLPATSSFSLSPSSLFDIRYSLFAVLTPVWPASLRGSRNWRRRFARRRGCRGCP